MCSRLSKQMAKGYTNLCSLILKSISCVETKSEKLLRRSLFAVASLSDYKNMLLLPTPMAVSQLYASIAQHYLSCLRFIVVNLGPPASGLSVQPLPISISILANEDRASQTQSSISSITLYWRLPPSASLSMGTKPINIFRSS